MTIDASKTSPEKLAEMNDSLITDNRYLRGRVAELTSESVRLKKAIEVLKDFAGSVGGSSSFWEEYWPQFDPENEQPPKQGE